MIGELFEAARQGDASAARSLQERFPVYPLNSPGLSLPGSSFVEAAEAAGEAAPVVVGQQRSSQRVESYGPVLEYLYRRALYDENFSLAVRCRHGVVQAPMVPGHVYGHGTKDFSGGPRRCSVMLLGKMPGRDEVEQRCNFVGPSAQVLMDALDDLGVGEERYEWYVDNLVHWPQLDPQSDSLPKAHQRDCELLLQQTLRLVRPDYLLCLGSDASKALLGTAYGVQAMTGRVQTLTIPVNMAGEPPQFHTINVMAATHPAAVLRTPELYPDLLGQLRLFLGLTNGMEIGRKEAFIRHVNVFKHRQLRQVVDEIRSDPDPQRRIISVDGEWEGDFPSNDGAYLRTVQFSSAHGEGFTVVLRHQGGEPAFKPTIGHAIAELNRLLKTDEAAGYRPRVGGHFLRADLPWLMHAGMDVRDEYAPPDSVAQCRAEGGWDTGLMYHAVNEATSYRLTDMTVRLTTAPVYDTRLKIHISEYCKKHDIKKDDLEGFGFLPAWILHPEPTEPEWGDNYSCLHGDSLVGLENGTWEKISTLVKTRYSGKVRAFHNGRMTTARVTNWHRRDVGQKDWRQIITRSTKKGRWGYNGPAFTPEHEVYTRRGKVEVQQLIPGEDEILTDELTPSDEQFSVLLGSLLGDGGIQARNDASSGLGFSQCEARAAYAHWKADALSDLSPKLRERVGYVRYETPYSKVMTHIAAVYPRRDIEDHTNRKLKITEDVLDRLGMLGLAVWYMDDGTLARDNRNYSGQSRSRIYAAITEEEIQVVVAWFTDKFGQGVSYNGQGCETNRFIHIAGEAFLRFQEAIRPYVHPIFSYKLISGTELAPYQVAKAELPFYETVTDVVRKDFSKLVRRGNGVRYCLTVEGANNFLTQAGVVSNCYDSDVTRRIAMRHLQPGGLLDSDWYGNPSWEPFWRSHRASLGVLEMELNGIELDKDRVDQLTSVFMLARDTLLEDFRRKINWPDFNPESAPQCVALLFGDEYSQKRDKETGRRISIRPPGTTSLGLTPVKTTGRRSRLWEQVVSRGEAHIFTPSTDKEVLGILGHSHPLVMQLRDLKFISQVLKGPLRLPVSDDRGGWAKDESGHLIYAKGLGAAAMDDGRIHTHISQNKETGRGASSRPPLQNISKRREGDYKAIMGSEKENPKTQQIEYLGRHQELFPQPLYRFPVRTIFKARDGYVLIEADYTGAELAGIAWLSGDPLMIEHVRRNMLPESDPDHYDIHSHAAVDAFRLTCEPTKGGLSAEGLSPLRIAAKAVNFGIPYGRSADAIARQCKEEGVTVSEADCQMMVDDYFRKYPGTAALLEECRRRSQEDKWLAGSFGRLRRFVSSRDRSVIGEQERQAQNFPIQNMVADAVWQAIYNFYAYRRQHNDCDFGMLLPIHDALLFEVRVDQANYFVENILTKCMVDDVPIWPRRLDNVPIPVSQPYHFGIDCDIQINWGEKLTKEQKTQMGITV